MYNAHRDAVIDERDMIVKAIAKYSERERKLITCRYIENMSWEEIADKIGCSVDYAKGYLRSITQYTYMLCQVKGNKRYIWWLISVYGYRPPLSFPFA